MKLSKRLATFLIVIGFLISGLVAGLALSSNPGPAVAGQPGDDDRGGAESEDDDANEFEVPPPNTGITADRARDIAEAAYPDTYALGVEVDTLNESGGAAIYEVELANGIDVAVDANGSILASKQRNSEY